MNQQQQKQQNKTSGTQPVDKVTKAGGNCSKTVDPIIKVIQRPRRIPKKRLGDASTLDTADDDKYDDAWLPEYGDGVSTDKIVGDDWVEVKKPTSTR
ncbi:uncharacterized protein CTRU02_206849 [Colletotrichum truncatum]|uniref:Uncharacterized protein n=1 Tax=Colletotrichum truncatum TaxID=5467 RepID=A0ACC3YYS8_COLTU|nr:uncharacterized protein CTRU02_14829 [Colletotrichum truncatum]KAF6781732.1 hypothetical protein CTRU02_14829 [Colletotrichum truncatum]